MGSSAADHGGSTTVRKPLSDRALLLDQIERLEVELADARQSYAKAQEKARPVNEAVTRAFNRVHDREHDLRQLKIKLAQALDIGANGGALSVGVGDDA